MNDNDFQDPDIQFDYESVTDDIRVQVQPIYLKNRSDPAKDQYIWAYRVRISNESDNIVQLLSRHWEIVNLHGAKHIVDGEGVVGLQPVLKPLESFEYTSGTPLNTPSGIMSGFYRMTTGGEDSLQVEIPAFALESPHNKQVLH